jgi:pSer/pThr/pTyr-binding forkhead associated (FHA) protein
MALKKKITNPDANKEQDKIRNPIRDNSNSELFKEEVIQDRIIVQNNIDSKTIGWLIVHTENIKSKSFELKANRTLVVGRKEVGFQPDIAINFEGNTDRYFSRKHMEITTEFDSASGITRFFITDTGTNGKGSTNGTFVDGQTKRILPGKRIEIFDGATIQAGRTKLVLKTANNVQNAMEATQIVAQSPYTKTIIE